jgi:hypothetical protein
MSGYVNTHSSHHAQSYYWTHKMIVRESSPVDDSGLDETTLNTILEN